MYTRPYSVHVQFCELPTARGFTTFNVHNLGLMVNPLPKCGNDDQPPTWGYADEEAEYWRKIYLIILMKIG